MQLNTFLMKNNLTMATFASRVGTTAATISRVVDRSVTPRRALVERIYEETGGQVTPNDLAGLYCVTPCRSFPPTADQREMNTKTSGSTHEQQ